MMTSVEIILEKNGIMPTRAHNADAGYDLYTPYTIFVAPGSWSTVDIGVKMSIPTGYWGQIISKSGLMKNKGITVRGVVDSGYQGSIKVVLFNHSDKTVLFDPGDKIAQLIFLRCEKPELELVEEFETPTERGEGGFGSTGKN